MERRDFMRTAAVGVATAAIGGAAGDVIGQTSQGGQVRASGPVTAGIPEHPEMKYRSLGRTGERVSLVGLGGFHLAKQLNARIIPAYIHGTEKMISPTSLKVVQDGVVHVRFGAPIDTDGKDVDTLMAETRAAIVALL